MMCTPPWSLGSRWAINRLTVPFEPKNPEESRAGRSELHGAARS